MRNFLQSWNFTKHAVAVTSLYVSLSVIGNTIFGKKVPEDEKSLCPLTVCKQVTTKQWVFNGILAGMYTADMSLGYLLLRRLKKQYK